MTESEAQQIIQTIMELAAELGWGTLISQTPSGELSGLYIGSPQWIESKVGKSKTKH